MFSLAIGALAATAFFTVRLGRLSLPHWSRAR
jgi:hypothetical protein